MKTNQLPPKLVEKITPLLENYSRGNKTGYVQGKCVQLIIDYAQPFKDELSKWIGLHEEKDQYAKLIERQRDELLEALRYIASADIHPVKFKTKTEEAMHLQQVIDNLTNKAKKSIENYECIHSSDKWCISCYESKKDTIIGVKKHEDGKL